MEKVWTDFPFWLITTIMGMLLTFVGILGSIIIKKFYKGVKEAMNANTLALEGVKISNIELAGAISLITQDNKNFKESCDQKHGGVNSRLTSHSNEIKCINKKVAKHDGLIESNTDDIKIIKEKHMT